MELSSRNLRALEVVHGGNTLHESALQGSCMQLSFHYSRQPVAIWQCCQQAHVSLPTAFSMLSGSNMTPALCSMYSISS